MQTTTPKINNMTPVTGRMVNEQDEIVNVVDNFGSLKTSYIFKVTNNTNQTINVGAGFNWIEAD